MQEKCHKKTVAFVISLAVILLSGCSGYNKIMRDHLSDIANYATYDCQFVGILESTYEVGTLYLDVSFTEDVPQNLIDTAGHDETTGARICRLEVPGANRQVLETNHFFDTVSEGTVYLDSAIGLLNVIQMMNADKSLF